MGVHFIVEETFEVKSRGAFAFARPVAGADFRVVAGSTLGGVAVKPYVDMPRRILEDGRPDLACFQFELVDATQLGRLNKGARVTLEPGV